MTDRAASERTDELIAEISRLVGDALGGDAQARTELHALQNHVALTSEAKRLTMDPRLASAAVEAWAFVEATDRLAAQCLTLQGRARDLEHVGLHIDEHALRSAVWAGGGRIGAVERRFRRLLRNQQAHEGPAALLHEEGLQRADLWFNLERHGVADEQRKGSPKDTLLALIQNLPGRWNTTRALKELERLGWKSLSKRPENVVGNMLNDLLHEGALLRPERGLYEPAVKPSGESSHQFRLLVNAFSEGRGRFEDFLPAISQHLGYDVPFRVENPTAQTSAAAADDEHEKKGKR